jgi:hypothetical protein
MDLETKPCDAYAATMILIASLLFAASTKLPIINDDYPRARAQAIQRNVPLFVDVWAPW